MKILLLSIIAVMLSSCVNNSNPVISNRINVSSNMKYEKLPSLNLQRTKEVEYSINYFLEKDKKYLEISHNNRAKYHEDIKYIFDIYGIPEELINIAIVESKFDPKQRSKYGARGVWQFMSRTAKVYGLKVSVFQDERKDVLRSSEAAARMLRDLYNQFGDWYLVLASYNSGQTRIRKTVRKHNTRDFWKLAREKKIPSQTKAFVSRIIALSIIEKGLA